MGRSDYALLATVELTPGEQRTVRVQALVPGLTSVPQGVIVDTGCAR